MKATESIGKLNMEQIKPVKMMNTRTFDEKNKETFCDMVSYRVLDQAKMRCQFQKSKQG